jgi:hypothetical protein
MRARATRPDDPAVLRGGNERAEMRLGSLEKTMAEIAGTGLS